ncbi:MAG: helix-turn-helix transcriptional regulator [Lachnospiraceae bacterium]|nr:helix-turn-helix transcriptional regulator [Lachnospiraceae bacterium]
MLLLYLLSEEDYYGYQLSQLVKKRSNGILTVPEGSMYPTLYRLAEKGYLSYERRQVGKRLKRVYYHLEPAGKDYLKDLLENYKMVKEGVNLIMTSNKKELE